MSAMSDLRAAVARADEVLGCGRVECLYCSVDDGLPGRCVCHARVGRETMEALYKAAKALVATEEPRERWVDAEGVTRLPRAMREELGVGDGAHIWFLRGPERWEAWRESEVSEMFGSESIPVRGLDLATLEPHLSREVKAMGVHGTITEHKATSSCVTPLDNTLKTCWCYECLDDPSMGLLNPTMVRMITCPQCGNKRCPRATSHENACSGSNEPGQDGSRYK